VNVSVRLDRVARRPTEIRTPGEPWSGVERLVVARDDRLGDVILSLPAVAALRLAYPDARLALLVHPRIAPVARLVEGVDEVLAPASTETASSLARFDPELFVCISRSPRLALAARRAGVHHTVGPGRRLWSGLFERRVSESRRAGLRHETEYALSFAHRAGAGPGPHEARLRLPEDAIEAVRAWRARSGLDRPFVLLHPGTGGSCPAWPLSHWVRLAAILIERGRSVALSIGPDDDRAHAAFDRAPAAVRALGRFGTGLVELAALAKDAGVVVGNSTGPVHLAALMGTPTLAIHAPWPSCGPERWGPYAANGWTATPRAADVRWTRRRRRALGPQLLERVEPDFVAAAVTDVAEGRAPAKGVPPASP